MRLMALVLSFAFLGVACARKPPAPSSPSAVPPPEVAPAAPLAQVELGGFAKSSNALAFDLYARARTQSGNLALSPISISTALTMTWAGARGDTAAQMRKVLHAEGEAGQVLDVAGKLLASFDNENSRVTLRAANRLFGEKTYAFEAAFLDRTKSAFGAALEGLDFKHAADPSRIHINAWVAQQTQDRIQNLIPSGGITADTRLVLTNAIYFLGNWTTPFKRESTHPEPFHATAAAEIKVPTMNQTSRFQFATADGVKLLEMPYEGGAVVMTFVLPDDPAGLEAVETQLSPALLDAWVLALHPEMVSVALPKFEINPANSLALGDTLASLGMPLAFDSARADFSGIADPPNPRDRLCISQVFHKAFVRLDEKGTEAAAATAVVIMTRTSAQPPGKPPLQFRADHPFLFVLRHVSSGAILFMGRVNDPAVR